MNASADQSTDVTTSGDQMQCVKKVETVQIHSSPGQDQEQIQPVEIVHQPHSQPAAASNTSGGTLSNAAASVASTLESAKEAISEN
ncbi:UNVERIFIED_CONTAM: hypothetical protein Slati_1595400 [Sesamum latifolium]|uniref:Uncharacterized protein n=1 Tax=Sesamum latifolium TaxID=2727402 RepID=A0AAW2XEQ1_9LAMI